MDFLPLYVTGMFRSGTTLLARMLNAHPDMALASDAFLPFLKHLRDQVAREVLGSRAAPPQAPLADYFADADGLALLAAVQEASLDRPFKPEDQATLWPVLNAFAAPFSRDLAARFEEVGGATHREVYLSMLGLVRTVYGGGEKHYVGHKEVWAEEFTPVLHRAFPRLKSIHLVRDPRAVCASKNVAADKYPWLFLIRQWRKLAGLAWIAAEESEFRQNCLLLRYEDLVGSPLECSRRICAFLGLDFSQAMMDPDRLRDGDNTPWRRNSSYGDLTEERAISSQGAERWKQVLSPSEVELIEQLTFPLMHIFGYEPVTRPTARMTDALLFAPPEIRWEQITDWLRPYVGVDAVSTAVAMAAEATRLRMLETDAELAEELIDSFFLSHGLYEACRQWNRRPTQRAPSDTPECAGTSSAPTHLKLRVPSAGGGTACRGDRQCDRLARPCHPSRRFTCVGALGRGPPAEVRRGPSPFWSSTRRGPSIDTR